MAPDHGTDGQAAAERDDGRPREADFEALNDGCGCAEIWEYLSERRRRG